MRRINPKIWIALLCVLGLLLIPTVIVFQAMHRSQLDADLLTAIRNNDTDGALQALKQGADPNARGMIIGTSFSPSILDILRELVGKPSVHSHSQNPRMVTALMLAAQHGNDAIVRELLQRGGDVNAKRNGRETALVFAVVGNKPRVTQLLLEHGADPNAVEMHGKSVLLIACENGATDIIKALVVKGANLNVNGPGGRSLLEIVAECDTRDGVAFLLAHGANVSGPSVLPVLVAACSNSMVKNTRSVEALLTAMESAHSMPESGMGVLLKIAATRGDFPLVTLLLAHRIGTSRDDLSQALIPAPQSASYDTCRLLIDRGADVNASDMRGTTPLITAVISYGGYFTSQNESWYKPQVAHIARLLLEHGAYVNRPNRFGFTPLSYALTYGQTVSHKIDEQMIDLLLAYHPDLSIRSKNGTTILQLATRLAGTRDPAQHTFYSDVLRKLAKAGAK